MCMDSSPSGPTAGAVVNPSANKRRFIGFLKLGQSFVLLLLFFAGCSNSAGTAKLEGNVTIDGEPIVSGLIQFRPTTKEQANPGGGRIENGKYVAKGVPLGKVTVVITATRETGKKIGEGPMARSEQVSIVPQKYSKGIEEEIMGDASKNFELKTK